MTGSRPEREEAEMECPSAGRGRPGGRWWERLVQRRVTVAVGLLALLGVGWCVLGAVEGAAARAGVRRAEAEARQAAELAWSGDLESAHLVLGRAVESLEGARASLGSFVLSPLRVLPWVGTETRAGIAGVEAAREMALGALDLLDYALGERAPLVAGGEIDSASLQELRGAVERASGHVGAARDIVEGAPASRWGFIGHRLSEVDRVTSELRDSLRGVDSLLARLTEAVDGDRPFRLLLLLENGAERRATGGFIGWVAVLEVADGQVRIAESGGVGALQVRDADGELLSVPAPADYLARYGEFSANTTLWVNVNLSPDFPTVAGVVGLLYEASTGTAVDAVARVDLVGLGYLLDAFSGIIVDGRRVDGATLSTEFLIDSYRRFPDLGEQDTYLSSAMQQVFGQVTGGAQGDRPALLRAFRRVVDERRLSLAMDDPGIEGLLTAIGVDGAILPGNPGDLQVTTQNLAANKVDLFTETAVTVSLGSDGCVLTGELSVSLANGTPADMQWLPHEALGSTGRWLVSFYLPGGASVVGVTVDGVPVGATPQRELGRTVVSVWVGAEPTDFSTAAVLWQERLSGGAYLLTLQPQPLIVPATLSINGEVPVEFAETQRLQVPVECGS